MVAAPLSCIRRSIAHQRLCSSDVVSRLAQQTAKTIQDNWAGNWSEIQVAVRRRTIVSDASVGGVDDQHVGLGPAGDFGWD
jgi:hypothetical protein